MSGTVATYGFQSTALWAATLAAQDDDPYSEHREYLRSTFLRAREITALLLGELGSSVPHYTVHDITHADALWETADLLIGPDISVNPVEGFILGMAFLLHDAAMGLAAYERGPADILGPDGWDDLVCAVFRNRNGRWPTEQELAQPPAEITAEATSSAVREAHARQAGTLVTTAWTSADETPYYLLDDARLRAWYGRLLALLVESHWWSVERLSTDLLQEFGSPPWLPDWPLDPLKLACLLRLADATQIDARRAPTLLFLIRRPDDESRLHWRFQQFVNRPQLRGDRVRYTSSSFTQADAPAWWLALEYLRNVNDELRSVDDLMHDLGRVRFAARGVAGVRTPARFAELFPAEGWRPVDAELHISDLRGLVGAFGGEQLYGRHPEVAVRELVQNGHDAVMARRALDGDFVGSVKVSLVEDSSGWTLIVRDDGIGMDEDMMVHGLMDFGSSGWRTRMARIKYAGLMSNGFRPKGRFGIGFFSVFMLGDDVTVTTRRYDLGYADARQIRFQGLEGRPLVSMPPGRNTPTGTSVTVRLKTHPYEEGGMFWQTPVSDLQELTERMVPECAVSIEATESRRAATAVSRIDPFGLLEETSADEIFDRIYPPLRNNKLAERQRLRFRHQFALQATPVLDEEQRRIGLGVVGTELTLWAPPDVRGVTVVSGFLADQHFGYSGYLLGVPGRASRDQAELLANRAALRSWLDSQEQRLLDLGRYTFARQGSIGALRLRAGGDLRPDHCIAFAGDRPINLAEAADWIAARDQFVLASGWPLMAREGELSGGRVYHYPSGVDVVLPAAWVFINEGPNYTPFDTALPQIHDDDFVWARHDDDTWQQWWWRNSCNLTGRFVGEAARAWRCSLEDLLKPVEERQWSDTATLERLPPTADNVAHVIRLRRPLV